MLKTKAKYVPETKTVYGQDRPEEGLADEMTDVVVYIKKAAQMSDCMANLWMDWYLGTGLQTGPEIKQSDHLAHHF